MKTHLHKYIYSLAILLLVFACSTKKSTVLTRGYHSTTTKYNIMYNGLLAYDKGLEDLKTKYHDDFYEILSVERMQPERDGTEGSEGEEERNPNFKRAEDKAIKASQLHSIYVSGKEHNPQMDEAYLLLGKSRYHDNRYIPALEAFNYILLKYPDSDRIYEAKVWRDKTNLRLDYHNLAIKNLKKLLKDENLKGQPKADAYATLAQGYIYSNALDSAIVPLKEAIELTSLLDEKARYTFILAQINSRMGNKSEAIDNFQKIIDYNHRVPRAYLINAYAGKFSNQDIKTVDTLVFIKQYKTLLKDRENRAFQDVIFHQLGSLYDAYGVSPKAIENYNKSLKKITNNEPLKVANYRNIAEVYYRDRVYEQAGIYFDSTLMYLKPASREYLTIKHKRNNLIDIVKFEAVVRENDSILNLVAASPAARIQEIEKFIAERKIFDAKREAQEARANGGRNSASGSNTSTAPGSISSSFYFYSPTAVASGKRDFERKWGNRSLTDNWRLSAVAGREVVQDASVVVGNTNNATTPTTPVDLQDMRYNVDFFLAQIPTDANVIADLKRDRDQAYYQLGLIYSDRLKEYQIAADRLEKLLTLNPLPELIEPTKYHLYKIYAILDPAKAALVLEDLKKNHPNSQYTKVILNPNVKFELEHTPAQEYERIYTMFTHGAYYEVLETLNMQIPTIMNDAIVSKYELLRAMTIGRLEGLNAYKEALKFVNLTYPNSKEGKEADRIMNRDIPKFEQMTFKGDLSKNIKMIYEVDYPLTKEGEELRNHLQRYANDRGHSGVKFSADMYSKNKMFLVLHGVKSGNIAKAAQMYLEISKEYGIKQSPVLISSEDYGVVLIKKNWDEYMRTQNTRN